jgi:pyruvate/2-oxoacid:ferredoxin oxidoreductase alpha subunit
MSASKWLTEASKRTARNFLQAEDELAHAGADLGVVAAGDASMRRGSMKSSC